MDASEAPDWCVDSSVHGISRGGGGFYTTLTGVKGHCSRMRGNLDCALKNAPKIIFRNKNNKEAALGALRGFRVLLKGTWGHKTLV